MKQHSYTWADSARAEREHEVTDTLWAAEATGQAHTAERAMKKKIPPPPSRKTLF